MHFITFLPKKGIYTLLLLVKKEVQLQIGKLGIQKFPKGSYTYTGSALGSGSSDMKNRISRHFLKKKKKYCLKRIKNIYKGDKRMKSIKDINKQIKALKDKLNVVQGTQTEVYTRIVGYYRSVKNWNKGKRQEYNYRLPYTIHKNFSEQAAAGLKSNIKTAV